MPFPRSLRPAAFALLLAFSGSLHAAGDRTVYRPAMQDTYSGDELKAEQERRSLIAERAQNVFSILGAELSLQEGNAQDAMALYLNTLRRTQNADVAERTIELATSLV